MKTIRMVMTDIPVTTRLTPTRRQAGPAVKVLAPAMVGAAVRVSTVALAGEGETQGMMAVAVVTAGMGAVFLSTPAASVALAAKGDRAWIAAAQADKAEMVRTVAAVDVEGMQLVPVEQVEMAGAEETHTTVSGVTVVAEATVPVQAAVAVTVEMGVM